MLNVNRPLGKLTVSQEVEILDRIINAEEVHQARLDDAENRYAEAIRDAKLARDSRLTTATREHRATISQIEKDRLEWMMLAAED